MTYFNKLHCNLIFSACFIAALLPMVSHADETLTGTVSIIDGDTFEIHGQRIRLAGIDAPESSQKCYTENGSPWRCGQKIANNISKLIGRKTITCNISGNDRYGRHIGTCFYKGKNINKTIVHFGWAMAYRKYSTAYVGTENTARTAKRGIWTGPFIAPWDWRKGVRYE